MPRHKTPELERSAPDSLHLTGAPIVGEIRLKVARDLIEEADPAKIVRIWCAFYRKGLRDGVARAKNRGD